jgi:hypothetical protein
MDGRRDSSGVAVFEMGEQAPGKMKPLWEDAEVPHESRTGKAE